MLIELASGSPFCALLNHPVVPPVLAGPTGVGTITATDMVLECDPVSVTVVAR
jgi:hypothetical protein